MKDDKNDPRARALKIPNVLCFSTSKENEMSIKKLILCHSNDINKGDDGTQIESTCGKSDF